MSELFIEAFSPFVVNIKCYGLHSLRSGGETSAAKYGVPDILFKNVFLRKIYITYPQIQ
jgi:hypothetical protein